MQKIAVFAAAAVLLSAPSLAQNAGRFDGRWMTTVVCPEARDARGYRLVFDSQVVNGTLHGTYGAEGRAPWLRLEGQIQPDGSALLYAHGQTGDPDVAVGHVNAGTPYSYRATARFDGSQGSGNRLDVRPCNLSFVKR